MARWEACGRTILRDDDPIPQVMGIVNLTPDSFSEGAGPSTVRTRSIARGGWSPTAPNWLISAVNRVDRDQSRFR